MKFSDIGTKWTIVGEFKFSLSNRPEFNLIINKWFNDYYIQRNTLFYKYKLLIKILIILWLQNIQNGIQISKRYFHSQLSKKVHNILLKCLNQKIIKNVLKSKNMKKDYWIALIVFKGEIWSGFLWKSRRNSKLLLFKDKIFQLIRLIIKTLLIFIIFFGKDKEKFHLIFNYINWTISFSILYVSQSKLEPLLVRQLIWKIYSAYPSFDLHALCWWLFFRLLDPIPAS
jgi:hypothetical protein